MQDNPPITYAPAADPKKDVPRAARMSSKVEGDTVIVRMETDLGEPVVEIHISGQMAASLSQRLHFLSQHANGEIDNTSIH